MSGFWSSWVLVLCQLSGLNRRRFAHTARIANTARTVVNAISPLMSQWRFFDMGDAAGSAWGAAGSAGPSLDVACSRAFVDPSSATASIMEIRGSGGIAQIG